MSDDIKKQQRREAQARYYEKNRAKQIKAVREWREKNPDKVKTIRKIVYENYKIKDENGLSKHDKIYQKRKDRYNSDLEYREKTLAYNRETRKVKKYHEKYKDTEKSKTYQQKYNEFKKAQRDAKLKEKEELKVLLPPVEIKEPKLIKEPKQPKPAKPKATKKPKLVINIRKVESVKSINVQIKVTAPAKPLSTKEIWIKKQNELKEKLRSKERNHIDLKGVNKDPYAGMTLSKSIKVKV